MPKTYLRIITLRLLKFIPSFILVVIGAPVFWMGWNEMNKILGLKAVPVEVVGTGSMYPSLYWTKEEGGPEDVSRELIEEYRATPHLYRLFPGFNLGDYAFLRRRLAYGDLVAFQNSRTQEILQEDDKDQTNGFIKRIIATPFDTIELRDGFVYLNGQLLDEPYIHTPRSTYGGDFLADCQILTIPEGQYFVMGDNRKLSTDSRFSLGLVSEGDVEYHLPLSDQAIYSHLYRDTSSDSSLMGQPSLARESFLALLNAKRSEQGIGPLSIRSSLNRASTVRGEKILQNQDTTYSLKQATTDAGYFNILLGEFVSYGHFTAQELLDNLLYHPSTAKQVLNPEYSDLGISVVNREVAGCPTQVIVGHLGGFVPPQYDPATVSSWSKLRDSLDGVISSWESAQDHPQINQAKLTELLSILYTRRNLAQDIATTMEAGKWLTSDQESRIQNDGSDAMRAEQLATELNQR